MLGDSYDYRLAQLIKVELISNNYCVLEMTYIRIFAQDKLELLLYIPILISGEQNISAQDLWPLILIGIHWTMFGFDKFNLYYVCACLRHSYI